MRRIILGIVCILFSGLTYADVTHPENTDIAGLAISNFVCFNNDGAVVSDFDCDSSSVDEGYLLTQSGPSWRGGGTSGINGCGVGAVNPVSSATCPYTKMLFASCTNNEYVLVQTTKSGHFWAVKANGNCDAIAAPETTGLVPCRKNDAFDPVTGCTPTDNPPQIGVESGYIKLENSNGNPPPVAHCANGLHVGRMIVDGENDLLYICTQSGWITK